MGGGSGSPGSLVERLSEFLSSESVRENEWMEGGKETRESSEKKHRLDEKHGGETLDQCRKCEGEGEAVVKLAK